MPVMKQLLKAENISGMESFSTSSLLPSQTYISNCMLEYILDEGLAGYSYHLTGIRGHGKSFTTLATVYQAKKINPSLKVSFLTFSPNGQVSYHPSFDRNIEDSDLVVFNDIHNYLQAIRNGTLDKEKEIGRVVKHFDLVQQNKLKSVVVTDNTLLVYASQIGDKRLEEVLRDSHLLAENELTTGNYLDLYKISRVYGLNADTRLLWSIHHTRPNIRFLLALNYLYGDTIEDFNNFVARLKEEPNYKVLKGKRKNLFNVLLNKPEIKNQKDVLELTNKLKIPLYWSDRYQIQKRLIEEEIFPVGVAEDYISADLLIYNLSTLLGNTTYVPTALGEFQDIWSISGKLEESQLNLLQLGWLKRMKIMEDFMLTGKAASQMSAVDWNLFGKLKNEKRRISLYTATRTSEFAYTEKLRINYRFSRNYEDLPLSRTRTQIESDITELKRSVKKEEIPFTFVLGGPVHDIVMPRIIEEGIQIR